MRRGPSPVIPLLLVGALGWLALGSQLLEGWSVVAEVQESWLVPVFVIPTILFLLIFLVHEIVVLPLILILVAFAFRTALIVPLLLLLVIVLSVHYSGHTVDQRSRYSVRDANDDQGGFGFGAFMLVMLFLIVSIFFCEEDCYWWISLILVFPLVYLFSSS